MKKSIFALLTVCCSALLPLNAAPNAKAEFDATVKYVDAGGELFYYQNNTAIIDLLNNKMPAICKLLWQDETYSSTADRALASLLKAVNIQAFKAQANSSVEVAPNLFINKTFALVDMKAKSILLDPEAKNVPMDFLTLPTDTRIAFKGKINLANVWALLYAEIQNSPDQQIQSLVAQIENLKAGGFDIPALVSSINGDMELLVTGTSPQDMAYKIAIPDTNGSIAELLKKFVPPQDGSNSVTMPTPVGNITVVYGKNKITAVSDAKLLSAPQKTLASLPKYTKFAAQLPTSGTGYFVIDLPQETIDFAKAQFDTATSESKIISIIDLFARPAALVAVHRVEKNGVLGIAVSDFSVARLIQTIQASIGFIPLLSTPQAVLRSRDRGAVASCMSELKQFGLACHLFAEDHQNNLPKNAAELCKDDYISQEICENIIYLANGQNLLKVALPSNMPIAICNRSKHNSNQVNVLLADGHVEVVTVPEEADNREVIAVLYKKYNFAPDYFDQLVKKVSELEK